MTTPRTTWRRPAALGAAALVTALLGFAVRYGEDNQISEPNVISFYIFILAGLFAYLALLRGAILLYNHLKNRRS